MASWSWFKATFLPLFLSLSLVTSVGYVPNSLGSPKGAGAAVPKKKKKKSVEEQEEEGRTETVPEEKEAPLPKIQDLRTAINHPQQTLLTGPQAVALNALVSQLTVEKDAMGNHISARQMTLEQFYGELQTRFNSGSINSSETEAIKSLDFHSNGPVAQWLADHEIHPSVLVMIKSLLKADQGLTGTLSKTVSFRMPTWFSMANRQGLASEFKDAAVEYQAGKVFDLDDAGKPHEYDPALRNVLTMLGWLRQEISRSALIENPSRWSRIKEHFRDLAPEYENHLDFLRDVETIVNDLQGLKDSILFKLTTAETPQQILEMGRLLNEARAHRNRVLKSLDTLLRLATFGDNTFSVASTVMYEARKSAERAYVETRRFCAGAIDRIDVILGADISAEAALANDTPWELAFLRDKRRAELVAARGNWEEIRTHEYLTNEDHYTVHYTYEVDVDDYETDSKGNRRKVGSHKETRHHYENYTKYQYATNPTPHSELAMEERIRRLNTEINASKTDSEVEALGNKVASLYSEQAQYVSSEPKGDHDYSPQYLARNQNLLAQIRNLSEQLLCRSVQIARSLETFERRTAEAPHAVPISKHLSAIDARHGRNLRRTAIAIGTTIGLGVAGYCAHLYMLSNAGGL